MQKEEVKAVWERYREGRANAEDLALLESWYLTYEHIGAEELTEEKITEGLQAVEQNLPLVRKTTRLWIRSTAVAASVAMVVFGIWFFTSPYFKGNKMEKAPMNYAKDIAPGKNGAVLTLANGRVIQLSPAKSGVMISDDRLTYVDGTVLGERLDPAGTQDDYKETDDIIASTAIGQTYMFTLSDGTKVWLNAASKLQIPIDFSTADTRVVHLEGEAYFEVAKSSRLKKVTKGKSKTERIPFIVSSRGQKVEVLGTHFNVNAYADEAAIKTTLLEGAVQVIPVGYTEDSKFTVLKPNQQSILTKAHQIMVNEVNAESAVAWKNGFFDFNDTPIKEAMAQIARWYDVEVSYTGDLSEIYFKGRLSRNYTLSQMLKVLGSTGSFKFKVEGRRIKVMT
ncbi:FecR family protein [Pedobacter nyackensis]|uniref:FecR family protein n=1 Tax=Pedobacter nyackensis TaxID=475255 RepID=UPI0029319C09|nr:FecR domain-containing protein [Pedobacter nyackensis]